MDLEAIQKVVRRTIPDAVVSSAQLDSSCGCYSEYTTESCRFEVEIDSNNYFTHCYTYPYETDKDLENWARNNEEFHGCACCSGEGHEHEGSEVYYDSSNSYLSVYVRLIKRK